LWDVKQILMLDGSFACGGTVEGHPSGLWNDSRGIDYGGCVWVIFPERVWRGHEEVEVSGELLASGFGEHSNESAVLIDTEAAQPGLQPGHFGGADLSKKAF